MAASTVSSKRITFLLLILVLAVSPLLSILLWFNYTAVVLRSQRRLFHRNKVQTRKPTILITGSSLAYGLNLARAFQKSGHIVIGADVDTGAFLNIARRSRAISKHYLLPQLSAIRDSVIVSNYISSIVRKEAVDLWIDCSLDLPQTVLSRAKHEIGRLTSCACIVADEDVARHFISKEAYLEFLKERKLSVPETHTVKSRAEIHDVLNEAQGRKRYLLKPPGKDESSNALAVLPRRTLSQTYHEVSLVKISSQSQMILEEYVVPSALHQCVSIVIRGTIQWFDLQREPNLGLGQPLNGSPLWQALQRSSETIAHELGDEFSGHLDLRFAITEKVMDGGVLQQIVPVGGAVRLGPRFIFPSTGQNLSNPVNAYLSIVSRPLNGTLIAQERKEYAPDLKPKLSDARPRYFLLDTIVSLVLTPCTDFILRRSTLRQTLYNIAAFVNRLLRWDEAFYDFSDPVPAFWQYTVVYVWATLIEYF